MSPNSEITFDLIDDGDLASLREFIIQNPPSALNVLDRNGNSLLSRAVLNGGLDIVKELCDAGVDLHGCDLNKGGEPALMYAFDSGDEAIIFELLARSNGDFTGVNTWLGIPLEERVRDCFSERAGRGLLRKEPRLRWTPPG